MQILFVDESGTPPPPAKQDEAQYFVLGGLVVPEDFWSKLAADLRRLKSQFGVSGEIKWRYFAPQQPAAKPNSLRHLSAEQKETLRSKLYDVIRSYKSLRLICVVTNVQQRTSSPISRMRTSSTGTATSN